MDKDANLVVIELKRTEDGGHMELQAIRYAAMVSVLTFDQVLPIFGHYLESLARQEDPRETLLSFLGWDEPDEDHFAQEVKIVLVSAEFSKEITTSVLWLNDHGLDIRCVRLKPYRVDDRLFLDVQPVIPLPEAEEYQVQIRNKVRLEKEARRQDRDFTKYDVRVGDAAYTHLPKRWAIFHVIKALCDQGVSPDEITAVLPWKKGNLFHSAEGTLSFETFCQQWTAAFSAQGRQPNIPRYFTAEEELIHANDMTYALTNQWGTRTREAMDLLLKAYPQFGIRYAVSGEGV